MSVELKKELERINARLLRIERMLKTAIPDVQPKAERLPEKKVIEQYGISRHVLQRLRMGYKRSDGIKINPMLFKWGHRKGRDFDYDVEELDKVIGRKLI